MSDFTFTSAQCRAYFEDRLGRSLPEREAVITNCPFHDDQHGSMSVNFRKGAWFCHTGCGSGGMVDFETKLTGKAGSDAVRNFLSLPRQQKADATYYYRDALGHKVFRKRRWNAKSPEDRKRFACEIFLGDNRYGSNMDGFVGEHPLYNLPEVVGATQVWICEGEADADRMNAEFEVLDNAMENRSQRYRRVATTHFDGAGPGKWKESYSKYLAGKLVVICEDNDEVGANHAEAVADSVSRYAARVQRIAFPELPAHADVSDFLDQNSIGELLDRAKKTPVWKPAVSESPMFVSVDEFIRQSPDAPKDWLVDNVIEAEMNGFIIAMPKAAKSFCMSYLAMALATGTPWFSYYVPRARRVAYMSREDSANLTRWRFEHIWKGIGEKDKPFAGDRVFINTRHELSQFKIEDDKQFDIACRELEKFRPELTIIDVFNVIHSTEENDNTAMRKIMDRMTTMQNRIGGGIGIIHHARKETGPLEERARGASSIAGWAEWLIGLNKIHDPDFVPPVPPVRRLEVVTKSSESPENVYFQIVEDKDENNVKFPVKRGYVEPETDAMPKKRRTLVPF